MGKALGSSGNRSHATAAAAIAGNVSLSARVCPEPTPAVDPGRGEDPHRGRKAPLTAHQPGSPTKNSAKALAPFGACRHRAGKFLSSTDGLPLSSCV